MYWNHRVIKRQVGIGTSYEQTEYVLSEVYYNDEDHSVLGWTEKEYPWGLNVDEIRQTLHWMLDATERPVLDEAELQAECDARPDPIPEEQYERLTMQELLDSLGLEREDVDDWENEGGST